MSGRDVVITGIGLVSALGIGAEANWKAFSTPGTKPVTDSERFKPYTVHPLPEIDWNAQIPKRGDQRQMETWQRLGTYTAGLALDDAGIKENEALCATMDMIVAAGGGERDTSVDTAILEAALSRNDIDVLLNEKLTTELRPTLFLAQLSNLLAGNISIVHKVTGSSRTFMGEEGAGVAALQTAVARIASGQSTHMLVGASFQTEHPDMLLAYAMGGYLAKDGWSPLWSRSDGGVITGSGAAFLVLESRDHAQARGRKAYATLAKVAASRVRRGRDDLGQGIAALASELGSSNGTLAVSGASGAPSVTTAEVTALDGHPMRGFSGLTGHLKEAQFPFAVALGALSLSAGTAIPPLDAAEKPFEGQPEAVLATAIGYHRYEGAGLLLPA